MNALFIVGRMLYGGFFVFNGINHFLKLGFLAGYAGTKGVPVPQAAVVVTGAMLVLGGLSILLGARPRIGVALIVLFLLPTSFIMHDFWSLEDPMQKAAQQVNFMKNLALAGAALMMLAVPEPWLASYPRRGR